MDFVVQKSTELGVRRITPVSSEYSVVRLDEKRTEKRVHHWRGIAASACEQCGRNTLPVIDPPVSLRNWLGEHRNNEGMRLILRPGSGTSLKSVDVSDNRLTVLVGPEGGFSDAEYDLAAATGFESAGLGPRVLRTETAALAVLTVLQSIHGDLA
jgi:16S rRNA (uracil1498-N3)-methyltransferase